MHKFGGGYVFSETEQPAHETREAPLKTSRETSRDKIRREGTFTFFQTQKAKTRWKNIASAVSHETNRREKHYASMATLTAKLMDSRNKDKMIDRDLLKFTREHEARDRRMQRSDSLSTINSEVIKVPSNFSHRNKNIMAVKIFGSYRKISLQNKTTFDEMEDDVIDQFGGYMTETNMSNMRPIERFRKAARLVTFLLKIKTEADRKYKEHKASLLSFAQLQQELEDGIRNNSDGLMFDPKEFKAVKEVHLSVEVVNILSLSPGTRSEEQRQTVLAALKSSVPAFGEYPLRMQQKLVSVGWFESFEAKRVIIRQGHPAENFYFILSGTALVTILTKDPKTGEESSTTVAVLTKGSSFGELALLHHKTRSATVICKDEVALLAVGREDFRDLFMSYEEGKEVEHISFLKNISYLQGLPLDNLSTMPHLCIFHYFRRGIVIVKNSSTEWIYFVKSGSCRVLTQITRRRLSKEHVPGHQDHKRISLPAIHQSEAERKRALYAAQGMGEMTREKLLASYSMARPKLLPAIKFAARLTIKEYNKRPSTRNRMDQERKERDEEVQSHRNHIEEVHDAFQKKASQPHIDVEKSGKVAAKDHVFVQIELLKPKDQFGLNFIQHDSQAIKCHLVSNGAECILISKQWFLANASEEFIKKLRATIFSYPSLNEIQKNYKIKENWDSYKTQTLSTLVDTLNL